MHDTFLESIVRSMGCDPSVVMQPGVTVKGTPTRAENHVSAGYLVGQHVIITCDPAAESMLTDASLEMQPTLAAWRTLAAAHGGELLGSGRMQLHDSGRFPATPLPDGYSLRTLDAGQSNDVALIERLVEVSDEDDLDEAEVELDNLDDIIEVILDPSGQIASYGSSRGFEMSPRFGDIGILTRPDCRGLGLGKAAVVAVCNRVRQTGDAPLYRCDEDNAGSIALSASLGFTIATQLTAYRFHL